jgi:hypothetical protein
VIVPVWICAAARDGTDSKARAANNPSAVLTVVSSLRLELKPMTLPPVWQPHAFSLGVKKPDHNVSYFQEIGEEIADGQERTSCSPRIERFFTVPTRTGQVRFVLVSIFADHRVATGDDGSGGIRRCFMEDRILDFNAWTWHPNVRCSCSYGFTRPLATKTRSAPH